MVFFDRGSWGKFVQGAVFFPHYSYFAARSTPPLTSSFTPTSDIGHFFDAFSRTRFFTSWLGSIQNTRSNPPPSSSSFPIRSSRPCTRYVHLMLKPYLHQTHGESRL